VEVERLLLHQGAQVVAAEADAALPIFLLVLLRLDRELAGADQFACKLKKLAIFVKFGKKDFYKFFRIFFSYFKL
jgi:hypothetical protein